MANPKCHFFPVFFPLSCLSIDGFSMQSGMAHPAIGLTLWCPRHRCRFSSTWSFDVRRNHGWQAASKLKRKNRCWNIIILKWEMNYQHGHFQYYVKLRKVIMMFQLKLNICRLRDEFSVFPLKQKRLVSSSPSYFSFSQGFLGRVSPKGGETHDIRSQCFEKIIAVTRDPCIGRPKVTRSFSAQMTGNRSDAATETEAWGPFFEGRKSAKYKIKIKVTRVVSG